jgi:hypothetical protein
MAGVKRLLFYYDNETPARTDNVLTQASAGAIYKRASVSQILAALEAADIPDISASYVPVTPQSNIHYVGKHGADTNAGTSPELAYLTFSAAIAAASAGDAVVCWDAGEYEETITCKEGVNIFAPNATYKGGGASQHQIVMAEMELTFHKVWRPSGGNTLVLFDAASGRQKFNATVFDDQGSGVGMRATSGSIPIVNVKEAYASGGGVLFGDFTAADHYHILCFDAYANSNNAILLQQNVAGNNGVVTIQHMVDLGYTGTVALDINAGTVNLFCNEIVADTAWDVASGATLNLVGCTATGTKTNAGTVNAVIADSPQSNPNYIHNAAAQIWQRFADPDVAETFADCDYGPDRWKVATSGTNVQCRRAPGDTQPYAIRLIQSEATARNLGLVQYWENIDCSGLQNQQVTLSVRVRCSSAITLHGGVLQWGGTADQPSNDPWASWPATWDTNWSLAGSGSVALSANTWADLQVTMTLGTFANCGPAFWTGSTLAQNATLEFEKIKVELGATATPFEVRPAAAELALCQRYYQVFNPGNAYFVGYMWAGENDIYAQTVPLLVEMRSSPSVTDTNPTWSAGFPGTTNSASFYAPGSPPYVTTVGTFDVLYDTSPTYLYFIYNSTPDDFAGASAGNVGRATFGTAYRAYLDAEI